jgi:predicted transcriptional regulator
MTDREALHALVDALPDDALANAVEALRGLATDEALSVETEARIRRGIADAERGAVTPAAEVFRAMHERLDAMTPARG